MTMKRIGMMGVILTAAGLLYAESIIYSKIDGTILRTDSELIKYSDSYIGGRTVTENPNWDVMDIGYGRNLKALIQHEEISTNEVAVSNEETGEPVLDEAGQPVFQSVVTTNAWEETIIHTNVSQVSDFVTKEVFIDRLKSPELKSLEGELFQWLQTNGLIGVDTTALSAGTDAMVLMWLRAQASINTAAATPLLIRYLDLKTGIESLGGRIDKARR
jgi:hypothetical protein